ncbi:hypothetical protein CHLNCDRAFT_138777 [Chlorella variabilis]|uniref:Cupin type-2 domain-containing protein n=1 Tax=Chlorella variabilis TaxID=554065 RepID=E1ZNQ9_CHLVA|nr:hypothetical protein CHLNCDRAFT_138777 [Chlorella variabilis]EFN52459.1 hypothetical protein CHLNCDRAFT_138777 [Chlorella variabilis]|eukprot:XP_005844561.1 hypothetical protein CHLNCDRAFT_138777 [Chlorella variabilis]
MSAQTMLPAPVRAALAALGGASTTVRSSKAVWEGRKPRKFSIPVSLKTVERDWAQLGFHCGCMIDPPGHEWNNFTHDANELVAVVEGRMLFTLLDDSFELDPGDDIFIPAGVPHSTKNIAATASTWAYGYDGAANSWF